MLFFKCLQRRSTSLSTQRYTTATRALSVHTVRRSKYQNATPAVVALWNEKISLCAALGCNCLSGCLRVESKFSFRSSISVSVDFDFQRTIFFFRSSEIGLMLARCVELSKIVEFHETRVFHGQQRVILSRKLTLPREDPRETQMQPTNDRARSK